MDSLQCEEDLCGDLRRVLSVGTTLSQFGSPIQTNFCHSMADPDPPASTATTTVPYSVPFSSVHSPTRIQRRSETSYYFADDAECDLEGEALKDFWSEFSPSVNALFQRGVEEINQEVDDDQMGRPVLDSRKRHKGLLGGITEFYPIV